MTNSIANLWRSLKFRIALTQGNSRLAQQRFREIEQSGAKLSLLEQVFKDWLQADRASRDLRKENIALQRQITTSRQQVEQGSNQEFLDAFEPPNLLQPHAEFIDFITESFQLVDRDATKVQCTGIDQRVFDEFEFHLAEFIETQIKKISPDKLPVYLEDARKDIEQLKRGQDPEYRFKLTPHVYFIKYFLDNVYCSYLAWFLVYRAGLLPTHLNVLDIAAGPGTVAYGLALFLRSTSDFFPMPQLHISYYSLEQLDNFQYRGLQFWRRYIESQPTPTNAYFRFDTANLFELDNNLSKFPQSFFDFVVVSHCLFVDSEKRSRCHLIYRQIFAQCLRDNGMVMIIVQGSKLFKIYNSQLTEDIEVENKLITEFIEELGLKVEWYKYLTSTGKRTFSPDFGKFARENLPLQTYMSKLRKQYLEISYESHYALDDYVILAKR